MIKQLILADHTTGAKPMPAVVMASHTLINVAFLPAKMKDEMKSFQSPVGGAKIMEFFSLKEGKIVGEIKKSIEDAILDETISNTYEDAFNYMLKIKDKFIKN